ncbi:MAG TPA: hypothetical protein VGD00_10465 [Solirubrobacteraceae bacterium]|jgi:hypothetical protein
MSTPEQPGRRSDPTQPTEALRGPAPPPPAARVPREPVYAPVVEERAPPPYPPEDPWWSNPWATLGTAVIALLLGAVLGYAIGNSGESSRSAGATSTVTSTHTVVQPRVVVRTNTVTASTVTQAPPNAANEQRRVEAEANQHKLEKENEELRRQTAEGG